MKGVILAGGLGTRLYPITYSTNKHLLPVYNKPMVFYPIETLVQAGIDSILVVTGGPHAGHFLRVLQNGKQLGIKHIEFAYQEGESGIAHALALAEDFAGKEKIAVILGDNCTDADISTTVKDFDKGNNGAMLFLKKVYDPKRFGVPIFDENRKILRIEEKPVDPKSNLAVTGLYLYDNTVFEKVRSLKPSARGEIEITDLNNLYVTEGTLVWQELNGYWSDAGTFDSLFRTAQYWREKAMENAL